MKIHDIIHAVNTREERSGGNNGVDGSIATGTLGSRNEPITWERPRQL